MATRRTYSATLTAGDDGKVYVPVPFDPDEVWGTKTRHMITGTVDGIPVRGEVQAVGGDRAFVLSAAWIRDRGHGAGDHVQVVIEAEGPQRGDLADDIAAALTADPKAGESFDGLAQFYRKAFLTWIDSTRRRPEERPIRIAKMVELLQAGKKQR